MNVETPSDGGSTEYIQHHLHFLQWQFGDSAFWTIHLDTVFFTVLLSALFHVAMTFVVFAGYGLFAAAIRSQVLSRPYILAWMRRVFAGAFVALGARLAFSER